MSQLALPLQLADHAVFSSFHAVGNEELVQALSTMADGESRTGCWLWGAASVGKTHLLQAACERAGDRAAYVPIDTLAAAGPALIDGLQSRALVCIDDIDRIAGDEAWERGLFLLYNELLGSGHQLIASAAQPPRECPFGLDDLKSRMTQLPIYNVRALADGDRADALQLRARHRGLDLPEDTARYLLTRTQRDMSSLYGLLDTLDAEALRAQRRLTVPFVREVLNSGRASR